ncbi:MAG TPA: response regulator, partial [Gemmataceae bacterium]|nr:response regulator [Gemmataceae bacterium]
MPDDKVDILIVDDLPEKVLVYRAILDDLGENLVVARSGAEALAEVLKREFAVILLDVYMPGMDGLETAAMIRQRKKSAHTPIIFVTALADELRAAEGYAHGAVDYILAPVIPSVLRAKVKVFVDLFRMTRQVKRQAEERVALAEERSRRTAAEEANRRLAFLARAGAVLGQSLDYERTAADAARLPVPDLADLAAVVFAESAGGPKPIVARLVEGRAVVDESATLPGDLADAVGRAFARGVTEFCPPIPGFAAEESSTRDLENSPLSQLGREAGGEGLNRCPGGAKQPPSASLAQSRERGRVLTCIALPLSAGGRTVAVLGLARTDRDRWFTPADLATADALASRAASALENARLYREIQQADRQKNEFLSMLAHELRNPLAPIRNAVAIFRAADAGPAAVEWAGGVIDRQVQHLVRLVDDLLDVSRITRGKIRLRREPVDVAAIVAEAVEACRPVFEVRRHHLDVALGPRPLWAHGDPTRLAQVFTNLLNNAAKYTEPGGRVWLTAGADESNTYLEVRVRDTGIGIAPDLLATVFDPFTQGDHSLDRSEGGLGIGLTLVRRLVELHGGTATAASEGPGRGSEFVVRLPLAPAEASTARRDDDTAETPLTGLPAIPSCRHSGLPAAGRRVLVVDDNVDGADSLARLLRLGGHEVRLAHDGPAALTTAEEFHPDAVILDIGLPDMNGLEVARRLRQMPDTDRMMLVAVTGYGRDEDRVRSLEAGFDYHFVKP